MYSKQIKNGVLAATALLLAACISQAPTTQTYTDHHTSQISLDWQGTYNGTIPCADCPGIAMALTLNDDNTYLLSERYLERDVAPRISQGRFEWDAAGNAIALKGESSLKAQVGENRLFLLDQEGHRITGSLASHYELEKAAGAAQNEMQNTITERYWKLVALNGAPVLEQARDPYLTFKAEGNRVHGNGGCNMINGSYTLEQPNKLTFGMIASTMMACLNDMQTERAFLDALGKVKTYHLNGDLLILQGQGEVPLARFEAVYM